MSDHVTGVVQKISEKPTRNGGTIYNVCLDTGGRDDEWFGHGFDEPSFQEGDEIEFDIEYNGEYANVDKDSVQVISEGDGGGSSRSGGRSSGSSRGSSRSSGRSSGGGGRAKPAQRGSSRSKPSYKSGGKSGGDDTKMSKDDWVKKDQMIRRQSCMNTAIALVRGALECGAVALPAKKGDKFDAYTELCNEEAVRLYDQYDEQVHGKAPAKRRAPKQEDEDDFDDDIPY